MSGRPAAHDKRRATLLRKSVADGECLIWTGALQPNGYGQFHLDGRRGYVHRAAYTLFVGPIPDGMHIDHLCRRRACIRPEHLEPVTQRTNNRRAAEANRRTHCGFGHEFTAENTVPRKNGGRDCRICRARWSRDWRARQAAAA